MVCATELWKDYTKEGRVFVLVRIFLALVSFGRILKRMMANLLELDGATSKKQDQKLEQQQQKIQENEKTIEANRETIESFAALLERTQQLAKEAEQNGPYNDSPDVKSCDMQFWLADKEGSVIVGMNRSFWERLQRQEGKAWARILTFVEEEYERRDEEEETS